jgi:hypothetical protein
MMLGTDASSSISLTRMCLSRRLALQRSPRKWALHLLETHAGRFYCCACLVFCHRLKQSSDCTYTSLILHSWNNPSPYLPKATFIPHTTPLSYYVDHFLKTPLYLTMHGPWDQDTDRKLLLCLVDPNLKAKWAEVATSMGPSFTSESVRYVFWKMGAWSFCCHTQCSRISIDFISTPTGRSSPSKFLISRTLPYTSSSYLKHSTQTQRFIFFHLSVKVNQDAFGLDARERAHPSPRRHQPGQHPTWRSALECHDPSLG